jgi:hypothetical protein
MIQVGAFDVSGGPRSDGAQFLKGGFATAALKTLVALAQGFRHNASHRFPRLQRDGLGEPVGFRVFDDETHGLHQPFFIIAAAGLRLAANHGRAPMDALSAFVTSPAISSCTIKMSSNGRS